MNNTRKECLTCLSANISAINQYLEKFTSFEVSDVFTELKDVMYFYSFQAEDIKKIIVYKGNYEEFPDEYLLEIEGVTNAILFHLKYKTQ